MRGDASKVFDLVACDVTDFFIILDIITIME